jgi:hypothetical protein
MSTKKHLEINSSFPVLCPTPTGFTPGTPATVRVKMFQVTKPTSGKLRVLGGSGKWGLARLELTDVSGSTGRLILHNAVGSVACPGSVNLQKLVGGWVVGWLPAPGRRC